MFEIRFMAIGMGRVEWGAPWDRPVIIIRLGKMIK